MLRLFVHFESTKLNSIGIKLNSAQACSINLSTTNGSSTPKLANELLLAE